MRECLACEEPLLAMIVHDKPHPTFGCVKECPTCYSPEEGICALDRTCEATESEGDVYVPVPDSTSSLVQEEDEEEEERTEAVHRRRSPTRRRSARRRSSSNYTGNC